MSKVIALANHKGGVCKTTLSLNLADALARDGLSVLLVDLDPQGNATKLAYSFDSAPNVTVERVLSGAASTPEAIQQTTKIDGVHLIGATLKLARLERDLQSTPFSSTSLLRKMLGTVSDIYDVVILDTPPSLNFLTANALAAAHAVFVPIESGSNLSLFGSDDMQEFIGQARQANPDLVFGGAILTKHDKRMTACKLIANALPSYYERVLTATVPPTTEIHKAQLLGKTMLQADREHVASRAFVAIAREIAAIVGLSKEKEAANVVEG